MNHDPQTIGIEQILKLSPHVDKYALDNTCILGEASGSSVLINTRILDMLRYPLHFDGYALFFLKKGAFRIDCNLNSFQVQERSLLITAPSDILHIPSHRKEEMDEIELAFVFFSKQFMDGVPVDFNKVFQGRLHALDNPCIVLNDEQLPLAEAFFNTTKLVLASSLQDKRDILSGLLSAVSYMMADMWAQQVSDTKEQAGGSDVRVSRVFEQFLALVSENYTTERGMQFYADRLSLTPKYLSKLIKQASGRSGPDWIDAHVVLEAKNLLRYSGLSLKEIAYALHFPNTSVFHKYFKSHTGMTPSEYRRGDIAG